ncbi:thiaminase II [Roseovarius sp. 2305UL8-3]|uniref:thiaminase II n=1 Tax=Roseovarius conchicola TaxID=3121636 RepID=UPI0035297874
MEYGRDFSHWRTSAGAQWSAFTQHDFVRGLGDGTLPREAFMRYLVQDYIFLIHFARAWALAVTKADTVEEMRLAAGTVDALINGEIALHIKTCAEAGLSEHDLFAAPEHPHNIAYTRYVLDAGHSGDFLDLLAALAPCVMGYGEIGLTLKEQAGSDVYGDWIATYSGEDYQSSCIAVGQLIDGAITRRLGDDPTRSPRWEALTQRFITATRLEVGFWDMGLSG